MYHTLHSNFESAFDSLPDYRAESIKKDLTPNDGKPLWPLSSYGPAKAEPTLIGGLDESPEELRFMAWQAVSSGNPMHLEAYKTYEANKISTAMAAFKNGEMNFMDAFKAAFETSRATQSSSSAFGGFGQPSASAPISTFGQPSSTSVFGQPSSAFSQPSSTSAFSQQPKSVFSQPSSAGQPSTFGQPLSSSSAAAGGGGGSAFGPGGVGSSKPISAFGQPAFGQPSQPVSPFSKPAGTSVFGRQPTFGQPGFGQPVPTAPSTTTTSTFGQPTFGQTSTPASSFIRPATFSAPVFGQPSQPVFGQPGFAQVNRNQQQAQQPASSSRMEGGFGAFAGKPASFVQQPVNAFGDPNPKPISAFGSVAPTTSMEMSDQTTPKPLPTLTPQSSSFSLRNDPYISMLPNNYKEVIPKEALLAFESSEFSWGYVPEWIPPVELR